MAIISNKLCVIVSPLLLAVLILWKEQPYNYYHYNHHAVENIVLQEQATYNELHMTLPAQDTSTTSTAAAADLCSPDQITQGQWIPITLPRPPYVPLSPRVRCMRTEDFAKPFSTYTWKPNNHCQVAEWNPHEFCRLVGHNQSIAFIGDSLLLEQYASLVHLMGDRARLPPKAVQYGRISRYICVDGAQQQQQQQQCCIHAVFRTDFFLSNLTQELVPSITTTESQQYSSPPQVVVLNRGAHYVPDDELISSLQSQTLPHLLKWNQQCQQQQQQQQPSNCLLIWRTTVPGHPYCQNFTQPATSVQEMQHWIETKSIQDPNGPYKKGEYHWQDFARQNILVKQQLLLGNWQSQLKSIRMQIMDAYQTNILRPESHRWHMNDCLHTCSPGGPSDWNTQWLLHILQQQQQQQP